MKKFARQVLTFILLFIIIIFSSLLFNYTLLNKSNYFKFPKNINTIVLGNSHPESAYNDSLIPNFKNLGVSGEAYFYTYLKTKKIISENNQISTVFIEFGPGDIDTIRNSWTWGDDYISVRLAKHSPLLEYPDLRFLWQKNSSAILRFFPKTFMLRTGQNIFVILIKNQTILSNNMFGGYLSLKRKITDSLLKTPEWSPEILNENNNHTFSKTNIKYLSKIINYCNQKGVHVVLIRTPVHKAYKTRNAFSEKKFKNILNTYYPQTAFLDFLDFPLTNEQFADYGHLNYKGANPYSIFFARLLKKDLLKKENKQAFIDSEISKLIVSQHIQDK